VFQIQKHAFHMITLAVIGHMP